VKGRLFALAAGVAAAIPVIASIVHTIDVRWTPMGDDALIGVLSLDTLTRHPPLVGQMSAGASGALAEQAYNLGPLLFWVFAIPARIISPTFLAVAAGILIALCVVGSVLLARRRGGLGLALATAVVLAIACRSLPAEALSDVWNPSVPVLPLTLVFFSAWSVACGEYRLLPLTLAVASFASQSHITFAMPAASAVLVAVVGLVLHRRRRARDPQAADDAPALRRWIIVSVVVGAVCWSAPLVDQAVHRPGNFVLLYRATSADEPTLGASAGLRTVAHAMGVRPWWLDRPQGPLERIADLTTEASAARIATAALLLACLAAALALGVRRRRADVVAATAIALLWSAALVATAASVPTRSSHTVGYLLFWGSAAGAIAWLVAGWSLWTLLGGRVAARVHAASPRLRAGAAVAGVAAAVVAGAAVAAGGAHADEPFDDQRAIHRAVAAALPSDGAVRIDAASSPEASFTALAFQAGLVYDLRRDGRTVRAQFLADALGDQYGRRDGRQHVVRIDADRPAPRAARVLTRLSVPLRDLNNPFLKPRPLAITVTLAPAPAGS
jgi:hypothetical protein